MIQIVERNPIWHIFGGKDKVVCEFDPDALTKQRYLKRKPLKLVLAALKRVEGGEELVIRRGE